MWREEGLKGDKRGGERAETEKTKDKQSQRQIMPWSQRDPETEKAKDRESWRRRERES